jgi:hypothetical protein
MMEEMKMFPIAKDAPAEVGFQLPLAEDEAARHY